MHDPYEDQLLAARYKAERDQARQRVAGLMKSVDDLDDENEHLRDMLNDVAWKLGIGREVHYLSGDNYDECHKRVLGEISKLSSPTSYDVAQVTASAYDLLPEEDRKAMRWVRDNGGLDEVEKMWELTGMVTGIVGEALWGAPDRVPDHLDEGGLRAELDRRLMPEGYEWDDRFAGAVDFFEAMHDLLYTVDCDEDHDGPEMVREVMRRLVPEGMEWLIEAWPRFEDDAPVKLGDMALIDGYADMVEAVQIWIHSKPVIYGDSGSQQLEKGQRVKRPAPTALAADNEPLEVGQTVWHEDGTELRVLGFGDEEDGETIVRVEYVDGPTDWSEVRSLSLTHTKPESVDTWQRIEEDAAECDEAWAFEYGHDKGQVSTVRDLVRRCRALAERERGE